MRLTISGEPPIRLGVDIYAKAVKKLREDKRTLLQLERDSGIPYETLRDIKNGITTDPQISTLRRIAKFYELAA